MASAMVGLVWLTLNPSPFARSYVRRARESVMNASDQRQHALLRNYRLPLLLVAIPIAFAAYTYGVPNDPPGFFTDESSIAYNAWTISQSGTDEHGTTMPLYFKAFGEYKNPVFIYLLSALYYLFGPSILIARLLSCTLGFLAALGLGLLARRISGDSFVGIVVALTALLTPWLIEAGRVTFEVAIYPLAIVLFLFALHRAQSKERWSVADSLGVALGLALLTYSYTIGRLFAPLLALGLLFFANRQRWKSILSTWVFYGVTLIPLCVFALRNPSAFTARYRDMAYIMPEMSVVEIVVRFGKHILHNLSVIRLLSDTTLRGVEHLPMSSVLVATAALAAMGIIVVLYGRRRDPWWRFVLYGAVASIIPASLAEGYFAILRMIPYVLFLLVLTVPALEWLRESSRGARPLALMLLLTLTFFQGAIFQWQLRRVAASRADDFDGAYPQVLAAAIARIRRPIHLAGSDNPKDHGRYVHAYWYGALHGVDATMFVRLPSSVKAPSGAVVISTEGDCSDCEVIMSAPSSVKTSSGERSPYIVYVAR